MECQDGKVVQRHLECKLKDSELLDAGKEMAALNTEITELEAEGKKISDKKKPKKERIKILTKAINTGEIFREVDCVWEYDWDKKIKHLRRLDTDQIVGDTQEIHASELQMHIDTQSKEKKK